MAKSKTVKKAIEESLRPGVEGWDAELMGKALRIATRRRLVL